MMSSRARRGKKWFLSKRDGGKCHYCEKHLPLDRLTLDHVVPVSQGGVNKVCNLVLSCRPCNKAKGDMSKEEFFKWRVLNDH